MKIMCDVCEMAAATVICCADEAALCAKCDVEVHAANKLASKHERLLLDCLTNKLPPCDICQVPWLLESSFYHLRVEERTSFIFCVEDRALFCKDCDEPIHSANSRAASHQRLLATGIKVALDSICNAESVTSSKMDPKPPKSISQPSFELETAPHHLSGGPQPSWAVNDLLQFSDYDSLYKKGQVEFHELEWWADMNLFGEQISGEALAAAEVPQLPLTPSSHNTLSYRPPKFYTTHKKPRIEIPTADDDEYSTVPDLG